ncbi:MAG: DUF6064 family protein [Acidobacteriota bacterium]
MSEWWTYHLANFLLFSPRTYYRLFELYNAAIWPAQIVALALAAGIAALARRGGAARGRLIAAALAACWLWTGIAFQANRYATINFAAAYFAWAFGIEASLLAVIGPVLGRLSFEPSADLAGRMGMRMFLFALLLEPLVGPILGRGWRQAEIFGVAPDPTAVGTLGILLGAKGARRWPLLVIPVLWCAVTGATLLAMKAPDFWIPPLAAALAVALAARKGRMGKGGEGG